MEQGGVHMLTYSTNLTMKYFPPDFIFNGGDLRNKEDEEDPSPYNIRVIFPCSFVIFLWVFLYQAGDFNALKSEWNHSLHHAAAFLSRKNQVID